MIQTITVTDAVCNFSELLNSIRYRGERYTILKRGKPSATIGPAEGSVKERSLSDLKEIIRNITRLEDERGNSPCSRVQSHSSYLLKRDGGEPVSGITARKLHF
jgi:antitoxin (DNA-binding transcriptional repressor) of toxin-antitoxin stability system